MKHPLGIFLGIIGLACLGTANYCTSFDVRLEWFTLAILFFVLMVRTEPKNLEESEPASSPVLALSPEQRAKNFHYASRIIAIGGLAVCAMSLYLAKIDPMLNAWCSYMLGLVCAYVMKRMGITRISLKADAAGSVPAEAAPNRNIMFDVLVGVFVGGIIMSTSDVLPVVVAMVAYAMGIVTMRIVSRIKMVAAARRSQS